MSIRRASRHVQLVACFVFAHIAYTPLHAETREEFAGGLEARLKGASCAPGLRTYSPIPDYKECGNEIGTESWFKCAAGVDKANRAIFYWNSFVERCSKGDAKKHSTGPPRGPVFL